MVIINSTLNRKIDGYNILDKHDYFWSTIPSQNCQKKRTLRVEDVLGNFVPSNISKKKALCENRQLFEILENVQAGSVDLAKFSDTEQMYQNKRNKLVFVAVGIFLMIGISLFSNK